MRLSSAAYALLLAITVSGNVAFQTAHPRCLQRRVEARRVFGFIGHGRNVFHQRRPTKKYHNLLRATDQGDDDILDQLLEKFAIPLQPFDIKPFVKKSAVTTDDASESSVTDNSVGSDVIISPESSSDAPVNSASASNSEKTGGVTSLPTAKYEEVKTTDPANAEEVDSVTNTASNQDGSAPSAKATTTIETVKKASPSLPSSEPTTKASNLESKSTTDSTPVSEKESETVIKMEEDAKKETTMEATSGSKQTANKSDLFVKMEDEGSKSTSKEDSLRSTQNAKKESDIVVKVEEAFNSATEKGYQTPKMESKIAVKVEQDESAPKSSTSKFKSFAKEEKDIVVRLEDDFKSIPKEYVRGTPSPSKPTEKKESDSAVKLQESTKIAGQEESKITEAKEAYTTKDQIITIPENAYAPPSNKEGASSTSALPAPLQPFQPFDFNTYEETEEDVETAVTTSIGTPISLPNMPTLDIDNFGLVGGLVFGVSVGLAVLNFMKGSGDTETKSAPEELNLVDKNAGEPEVEDRIDVMEKVTVDPNLEVKGVKDISTAPINAAKEVEIEDPVVKHKEATQQIMAEKVSTLDDRLSKMEENAAKLASLSGPTKTVDNQQSAIDAVMAMSSTPSATSKRQVEKIEEFCEAGKVSMECSSSISSYLGSVSGQRVDEDNKAAAKTKIISYLDSISPEASSSGVVSENKTVPSAKASAFSNYLDALSSGEVSTAPSPKAVAEYLDELATTASRIEGVEQRLSRLETSMASLPDNIASRLGQWQDRQDQKMSEEMEKIKELLMKTPR